MDVEMERGRITIYYYYYIKMKPNDVKNNKYSETISSRAILHEKFFRNTNLI